MTQFVVRMHQSQFKFHTNDNDNFRWPFSYWMMINMSTSSFNDGVKSAKNADHLSSWALLWWVHCSKQYFCKYIHLFSGMCQQKVQAGLDTHEVLTAQKYTDEMVRPHVKPRFDNHALAESTVFMRDGTKLRTERKSQDVLASATSLLLSANNPDICIIENLWSIMSRSIIGMNPLP